MVLSWLEQDKTWTSVHACDTRSSKVSVHQTRFVRMEHGDVYLETSMSSRTTSKSNSSNTSCERARDKVRRRRRFISPNNSFTTLISGTVEHNREHPQELLLRVLQRTKPCGTWCSIPIISLFHDWIMWLELEKCHSYHSLITTGNHSKINARTQVLSRSLETTARSGLHNNTDLTRFERCVEEENLRMEERIFEMETFERDTRTLIRYY